MLKIGRYLEISSYFKKCYDRKELPASNNDSLKLLHEKFPSSSMKEIKNVLKNHFKQWINDKSLMHLVSADAAFAAIVLRHLFNLPLCNEIKKPNFSNSSTGISS